MNAPNPDISKKFFPALTGYRVIAAWMVFFYHYVPFQSPKIPLYIKNFVAQFHMGVDMFFVLSGFLITYRYYDQHPFKFKNYLVNRFARIYPMYFLLTAATFITLYYTKGVWTKEMLMEAFLSFTLLKTFFEDYIFAGIPQGWTLTLEELFYFSAPLFFFLIRKKWIFLILIPITIAFLGTSLKNLFAGDPNGLFQMNFSLFIFEFIIGLALALFIKKFHFKARRFITYFGAIMIVLYCLFRNDFHTILKNDLYRSIDIIILSVLGIAPLIWGLIHEKTLLQRLLSTKTFIILGKSSYIFYLIHKGFIPNYIDANIFHNIPILFIVLNLISIGMFYLLEEPLNKWFKKTLNKS